MLATEAPFPQYFDADGSPLSGGYLYFGVANQNPETNPITVYWDAAGTQPAAQPIRTMNGYAVRSGSAATVYATGDYSLTVRDRNGSLLPGNASSANSSNSVSIMGIITAFIASLAAAAGSMLVGFQQAGAGAVARTVQAKEREIVSAGDFGTLYVDGSASSQAAYAAAVSYVTSITVSSGSGGQRPAIYAPPGFFMIDGLSWGSRVVFKGAGSGSTYFKQNAGITGHGFTIAAENPGPSLYDTDHSEISGITLVGNKLNSTIGTSDGVHCTDAPWAIATQYSPSVIMTDVRILNFTNDGIYLGINRNWAVLNNVIVRYNNNIGLEIYGYDGRVNACDFGGNGVVNVVFRAGGAWAFTACNIYTAPTNIFFAGSHNSITDFFGCQIDMSTQTSINIAAPLVAGQPSAVRFHGCRIYNPSNGTMPDATYPAIAVLAGSPASSFTAEVHLNNVNFLIDAGAHRWNYLVYTAVSKPKVTMNGCSYVSDGTNLQPFSTAVIDDVLAMDNGDTPAPQGYRKTGIGIGGAVVQATSKSTGVALNALTGLITMNAAALGANTTISFVLANSYVGPNDIILVQVQGGTATFAAYNVFATYFGVGQIAIALRNITGGSLSEAVQVQFSIIKGIAS